MPSITHLYPGGFNASKYTQFEPDTPPELAFTSALEAFGLVINGPIIPGQITRTQMADQKRGNKRNGWYLYFGSDPSTNIAAGVYGDWRQPDHRQYWCSKDEKDMTPGEMDAYRLSIQAMQEAAEKERAQRQDEAAREAVDILNKAPLAATHDYLTRKNVKPYGLYLQDNALLIPLRNAQGDIRSLQRIYPNGDKRFLAGGQTKGCFHLIGSTLTEPTYLAEGYATAATIHEVTGKSVIVAFNSGNLAPVLATIRESNPQKIIIAADNDRNTDGNPGLTAANKAAQGFLGVSVVHPTFQGSEGTDFNDLAAGEGIDTVKRQLHHPDPISPKGLLLPISKLQAAPPSWIIKGVIPNESIGVLFGPSSGGKSFAALDMGLNIAAGRDWHGRQNKRQGGVIYVCGEGQQGIANRIRAWEKYHGIPVDNLPFRITRAPVRFLEQADKIALIEAIQDEIAELGNVILIIIDTLNRNFGDGDENSTKDMTRFVDAVTDTHKETEASVLIVHHTNLTDGDRARGNGSLRNACDFEIKHALASKEGDPEKIFTLCGKKMKDGSEMAVTHFALKVVTLGVDEDGDDYGSCAIEMVPGDAIEGAALAEKLTRKMGARQKLTLHLLAEYRQKILTNQPTIERVTIERKHLTELLTEQLKQAEIPTKKAWDCIQDALGKNWVLDVNGVLLEVTELVEK